MPGRKDAPPMVTTVAMVGDVAGGGAVGVTVPFLQFQRAMARLTRAGDCALLNLECPLTDHAKSPVRKHYCFRLPETYVRALNPRIVVGLANNHILDFGPTGLLNTIRLLREHNIPYTGAGRNLAEASKPAILEVDGVRHVFIACADDRYGSARADSPGLCPADSALIRQIIEGHRQKGDVFVVSVHMGIEFQSVPSRRMVSIAHAAIDDGADVVVFHHAHCLSGVTRYKDRPVCWGLGNFVFGPIRGVRFFPQWTDGAVFNLITETRSERASYVDVHPFRLGNDGSPEFELDEASRARIARSVESLSRLIDRGVRVTDRLAATLAPSFVAISATNYWYFLRFYGLRALIRNVAASLQSHSRW